MSYDLDFFTATPIDTLSLKNRVLRLADEMGAQCETLETSPDFHRFLLKRGDEREVLDFVYDRAPQLEPQKNCYDNIRVDTPREIIANKISTLLGRTEIKDIIDLYFLEKAGYDLISLLPDAEQKDGGLEPATLSLLLDNLTIHKAPEWMVAELDIADLNAFIERFRKNLAKLALPE